MSVDLNQTSFGPCRVFKQLFSYESRSGVEVLTAEECFIFYFSKFNTVAHRIGSDTTITLVTQANK